MWLIFSRLCTSYALFNPATPLEAVAGVVHKPQEIIANLLIPISEINGLTKLFPVRNNFPGCQCSINPHLTAMP